VDGVSEWQGEHPAGAAAPRAPARDEGAERDGGPVRDCMLKLAMIALTLGPTTAPAALADPDRPSALADGLFQVESGVRREVAARTYQTADGSIRFTLDRTSGTTLMQFDGTEEVLALQSVVGPRNDEILRTDTGVSVVRITSTGGMVFYRGQGDAGIPAALEAARPPIPPPAPPPGGLQRSLQVLVTAYATQTGRPLEIQVGSSPVSAQPLMWDATRRAVTALEAARPERASMVTRVSVTVGTPPGAALRGQMLQVTVTPTMGWGGRPSSNAIRRVIDGG
jgi:hypothetical protein